MKVYVEGTDSVLKRMWKEEVLCLEGGSDVTPAIYGEENTASSNNPRKDYETFGLLHLARVLELPIVGICRGAQAMCAFDGGSLVQHMTGHNMCEHELSFEGRTYTVCSDHHQECIPRVTPKTEVSRAFDGTVEIVIYGDSKMLGFQPHPEWHDKGHECRELFFNLVDRIMK